MNPARRRDLRDQVARLLNVGLEDGDEGIILLGEELLRNCPAFLAHAYLLRVLKQALDILVTTTPRHVGHRQEGTSLSPRLGSVGLEPWLISYERIGIDGRVIVSVTLTRIDKELVDADGIDAGSIRH